MELYLENPEGVVSHVPGLLSYESAELLKGKFSNYASKDSMYMTIIIPPDKGAIKDVEAAMNSIDMDIAEIKGNLKAAVSISPGSVDELSRTIYWIDTNIYQLTRYAETMSVLCLMRSALEEGYTIRIVNS